MIPGGTTMFDVIHLAMLKACREFGDRVVFNGACFSSAFTEIAGVRTCLDGHVVRAMLCGRGDVEVLSGGAHYRVIPAGGP
jgi:hypothetical protein